MKTVHVNFRGCCLQLARFVDSEWLCHQHNVVGRHDDLSTRSKAPVSHRAGTLPTKCGKT